jgi:DNA-binding transcriptional LysR family regulator
VEDIQTAQIEAFLMVTRVGSFNKAAEALHVSQPSVTTRVRALEQTLGVALLERLHMGSRANAAGEAFLPHAERALMSISAGRRAVADLAEGTAGLLTVGVSPGVTAHFLPRVLSRFHSMRSRVEVKLRVSHSAQVLEMILRGEIDLGLMRRIHHPKIETDVLYVDPIVLVVPPGHAFAGESSVLMMDVAAEKLILLDRQSSCRDLVGSAFRSAELEPTAWLEVDNAYTASRMLESGIGIAFLPHAAVAREVATGNLVVVPVSDAPPMRRQIAIAWRRRAAPPSGLAGSFISTAKQIANARLPQPPGGQEAQEA